jgi:hypothetical protein
MLAIRELFEMLLFLAPQHLATKPVAYALIATLSDDDAAAEAFGILRNTELGVSPSDALNCTARRTQRDMAP